MKRIALILAIALGLAATAARAAHQEAVLGGEGEVYRVKSGTYAQLFPGGKEIPSGDRTNLVLALEIVKPDGSPERSLVPGTEGPGADRLPYLQYEETSRTVFLVWETRVNFVHPVLMLSGYNGSWLEPIEILGNPFAPKSSPQLAVTHDTYQLPGSDGQPVTGRRMILHLVWGEEAGDGSIETFYTPVILSDGMRVGRSPVFRLNDLDTSDVAAAEISAGLEQALAIRNGRDERTVVVAFTSPRSHRLITLEIDVLPPQLGQLADEARSHIVDIGAKLSFPADLKLLADEARSHIVDIGFAFHPEIARAVAEDVHSFIQTEGPGQGLKAIAEGARSHIVDIGAKLSGRGLRTSTAASVAASRILEFVPIIEVAPPERDDSLSHFLNVRILSDRPAPALEAGETLLFVSATGREALVAWVKGDRLFYRESSGSGWREPLQLRLSNNLNLNQAIEMLQERIQNR
jgi:hypothetical protein